MATANIKFPDPLTGVPEQDLENLRNYQVYLANELNYLLNNLDSDNIIQEEKNNGD